MDKPRAETALLPIGGTAWGAAEDEPPPWVAIGGMACVPLAEEVWWLGWEGGGKEDGPATSMVARRMATASA